MSSTETHNRQWALITGASSGIGIHYAHELAGRGYNLVLVSNQEREQWEIAEITAAEYGVRTLPVTMDLARSEAAKELYDLCVKKGIAVEILVNNAGIFSFRDVTGTEPGKLSAMCALHMETPTLLCRYFGEAMARRGHGRILNMASLAASFPFPGIAAYAASKSYLKTFSKAIHNELRDQGVTVTAVCPGAIATDLYNLPQNLQRLGLRLGVLMRPEKLARKGVRAMMRGRRCVMPGVVNYLFAGCSGIIPSPLVRLIKRNAKFYRYGG